MNLGWDFCSVGDGTAFPEVLPCPFSSDGIVAENHGDCSSSSPVSFVTTAGYSPPRIKASGPSAGPAFSFARMEVDPNELDPGSLSTSPNSVVTPDFESSIEEFIDLQDQMEQFMQSRTTMQLPPHSEPTPPRSEALHDPNMISMMEPTCTVPAFSSNIVSSSWDPTYDARNSSHYPPASSFNPYVPSSIDEPWSPDNPRGLGHPGSSAVLFDPDTNIRHSMYPPISGYQIPSIVTPQQPATSFSGYKHAVPSTVPNFPDPGPSMLPTVLNTPHQRYEANQQHHPMPISQGDPYHSITSYSTIPGPYPTKISSPESSISSVVSDDGQGLGPDSWCKVRRVRPSPRLSPKATPGSDPGQGTIISEWISGAGKISRPSGKGIGGRGLGSHLAPDVAKNASRMRKVVACWHCVLQRDKCGEGDPCERCKKRFHRHAGYGLGCSRIRLVDLSDHFIPKAMTAIHEPENLKTFGTRHILKWGNVEVTVQVTCDKRLPSLPLRVYEFTPKTNELYKQYYYTVDQVTGRRLAHERWSPPLGLQMVNDRDKQKYDRYINEIVDGHMEMFAERCFAEETNDFPKRLLLLMASLKPKADDEAKLLKEVFRLLVVTYIFGHSITFSNDFYEHSLKDLASYRPGHYTGFCSPRMVNKQLKYFFSRLHCEIMRSILNRLQQILKSSKGCDKWTSAFCAILGLAMVHEENQKTIHLILDTKTRVEGMNNGDAELFAGYTCRDIDEKFAFIMAIFRWKYMRSQNPLKDADSDWATKLKDEQAVRFVDEVRYLVKEKTEYLNERQQVSISSENQTKYTSRLVARFLLSFWHPT